MSVIVKGLGGYLQRYNFFLKKKKRQNSIHLARKLKYALEFCYDIHTIPTRLKTKKHWDTTQIYCSTQVN